MSISAGDTRVDVPFRIVNDNVNERTESFTATLSSPSIGTIPVPSASVTVSIADDDGR